MKKHTLAMKSLMIACSIACLIGVTGCKKYSPDSYTSADMQQVSKVDHAVVESFRQIDVSDPSYGLGATAGGLSGGVLGATVGNNKGAAIAAVGGALAGAVVGAVAEQKLSETTAFEYVLKKSDGSEVALAQKQDKPLPVGTHVLIIYGQHARIIAD